MPGTWTSSTAGAFSNVSSPTEQEHQQISIYFQIFQRVSVYSAPQLDFLFGFPRVGRLAMVHIQIKLPEEA
jgi:hypothetical protein